MLQNDLNSIITVITRDETLVEHFDHLTKSETKIGKHANSSFPKKEKKKNLVVRF